jgi:hypothetical protein
MQGFLHQESRKAVKRHCKQGIMVMEMLMTKELEEESNCKRERYEEQEMRDASRLRCFFYDFVFLF